MATELATAYISLVPSARGMKGNIERDLAGAGTRSAAATEKAYAGSIKRTGANYKAMFRTAALGAVGLIAGGAVAIKSVVESASNLNEAQSKVNAIFGPEGQAQVDAWAGKAAKAFGQSKTQATDAIGTYGNLLTSFGVGNDQALTMSTTLTGLASDLASFNNTSVDDAVLALRSGLSGETEPLKRYGVALDDASLKAKAFALGISDGKSQLSPAQKAQAAYALVLERTKNAQGDFARTSGGLANQQRIFAARWENLKVTIGQGLLPVVNKLMPVIGSLFDKIGPFAQTMGPKMNKVFADLGVWWKANGPTVIAMAQKVFGGIEKYAQTMVVVIRGVVDVIQTLWANFGDNIMTFTRRVWGPIQQYIGGVMTAIQGIIKTVTSLIHGDWAGVWEGLKQIATGAWNAIQGLAKYAGELLLLAISVTLETLDAMWRSAWDGFKKIPGLAWEGVKIAVAYGAQWMVDRLKEMPGRIASAVSGLFDGIKAAFRLAINWVIDKWNGFKLPKKHIPGTNIDIGGYGLPHIDRIPAFHSGGIYRAPAGATEGLALLRDGEEVLTPGQRGGSGMVFNGPVVFGDNARRTVRDLELWSMRNAQAVLAS